MSSMLNQYNPIDIVSTLTLIIALMAIALVGMGVWVFKMQKRNNALAHTVNDTRESIALLQRSLDQTRQEFHIRELYGSYSNNYLQAIETARRGATIEEIMFRHGLGEAEAKLILASHRPPQGGAH